MNNLTIFESSEFGAIRTVELDGEPWLVGKDVAQALGYTDTDQALRRHVDDEDKLTRNFNGSGQNRSMTIINCVDGLVRCQCGCFYGTVDEFRSKVRETHSNSKYAKEYLMIADLMELHFKED